MQFHAVILSHHILPEILRPNRFADLLFPELELVMESEVHSSLRIHLTFLKKIKKDILLKIASFF